MQLIVDTTCTYAVIRGSSAAHACCSLIYTGEEYKSCTYHYPYTINAQQQEGVIEMIENPAYVANTDYYYI